MLPGFVLAAKACEATQCKASDHSVHRSLPSFFPRPCLCVCVSVCLCVSLFVSVCLCLTDTALPANQSPLQLNPTSNGRMHFQLSKKKKKEEEKKKTTHTLSLANRTYTKVMPPPPSSSSSPSWLETVWQQLSLAWGVARIATYSVRCPVEAHVGQERKERKQRKQRKAPLCCNIPCACVAFLAGLEAGLSVE